MFHKILAFFGIYKIVQVQGHSMWSLIAHGDVIYTKKIQRYNVGDIVVTEHPFKKIKIAKIIERIEGDAFILKSQNRIEGEDSSSFGYIKKSNCLGKVVARDSSSSNFSLKFSNGKNNACD